MKKISVKCGSLDLVEAAHRTRIYPVLYCQMEIAGDFDVEKLKNAIRVSSEYVPEILYTYDFRQNRFVDCGFTPEEVVQTDVQFPSSPVWDLSRQPQLRVFLYEDKGEKKMILGMSHLLSDGAGFLQYLYLLASFYNGVKPENGLRNCREIARLLRGIHVKRRTEQTKYGNPEKEEPLLTLRRGEEYYLIKRVLSPGVFEKLRKKAGQYRVTMNDVFLTAYGRALAGIQNKEQVKLSCPADLRKLGKHKPPFLTVANMTGMYRDIVINCHPNYDFTAVLLQVHLEMRLQKSRFRCLKGIRLLDSVHVRLPGCLLEKMIRAAYRPPSISYTNIGVIAGDRLFFRECEIKDCVITGAYRQVPDFQLTVSTFQDRCTLNCALRGDKQSKTEAEQVLQKVEKELLGWIEETDSD